MDDNKSNQERLFQQSRELCKDTHIDTANALDMSQYSILGDETYTLDYIPRIDMSTPRGNIEDELRLVDAKALDISQYIIPGFDSHQALGRGYSNPIQWVDCYAYIHSFHIKLYLLKQLRKKIKIKRIKKR